MDKDFMKIRKATSQDVEDVHDVLSRAFESYRVHYTKEAYEATVPLPLEIEKRIDDPKVEVLVAVCNNEIVGTASAKIDVHSWNLHIRGMAVKPSYQGKGIGWRILEEICRLGVNEGCKTISLDCFEPLYHARDLYRNFSFKETGRKKNYHGIEVFEMKKRVITER